MSKKKNAHKKHHMSPKKKRTPTTYEKLNEVQKTAYKLIQSDARFLYTLTHIQNNAHNIDSNYTMMCQPYIGIFTDGAEQWCRKVNFDAPQFNVIEKQYYARLRQSHKLYELSYSNYSSALMEKLGKSDAHFYELIDFPEKSLEYYNVGTDVCNGHFCGNTILCALYTPIDTLTVEKAGPWLRDISVISGKIAGFFHCLELPLYEHDDTLDVTYEDYHFFNNCPIKNKTELGFILFSVLCSINYAIQFIEHYFIEEIPQKFKFAYLQYYYLCDFIKELNDINGTEFALNDSLKDSGFRNCLAHYGLGPFISEDELNQNDVLKGLTNKAFNIDYAEAKERLFNYLQDLVVQIEEYIF